jgi:energy-coupling factor transporter transmembrane protein EcfT
MKTLAKAILLVCVFAVTFFTPAKIGTVLYFSLFGVMFLCVWVWFHVGYAVSEKMVRGVCSHPFSFSLQVGMVPRSGSGDLVRGRLVITPEALELYRRAEGSEKGSCVLAWRLETSQVRSLGFGKVLSRYSGLIFYLDDGDVRFVSFSAKKRKQDILKELGWSQIPQKPMDVTVGGPAADAPSFKDLPSEK